MLGVKELRNHLRDFEKIYNLQKSATFKSKIIGNDPLTPTKIRKIRKMLKLTQFQFGNLLGISKTTISYWENGHLHPCRENQKILHTLATYGIVGLRRRGFTSDQIRSIKDMYDLIYNAGMNVSDACAKIEAGFPQTPERDAILNFIKNSKRGIVRGMTSNSKGELE